MRLVAFFVAFFVLSSIGFTVAQTLEPLDDKPAAAGVPCGTGLIFTVACNSQYFGVAL